MGNRLTRREADGRAVLKSYAIDARMAAVEKLAVYEEAEEQAVKAETAAGVPTLTEPEAEDRPQEREPDGETEDTGRAAGAPKQPGKRRAGVKA